MLNKVHSLLNNIYQLCTCLSLDPHLMYIIQVYIDANIYDFTKSDRVCYNDTEHTSMSLLDNA